MEHSNKNAPTIASPAAYGFGPSVAMPTLLGMMPQITNLDDDDEDEDEDEDEADGDVLVKYLKGLSPKVRTSDMCYPIAAKHYQLLSLRAAKCIVS